MLDDKSGIVSRAEEEVKPITFQNCLLLTPAFSKIKDRLKRSVQHLLYTQVFVQAMEGRIWNFFSKLI